MGMAPYGEPKYLEKLNDVVHLTKDGLFKLNLKYFRSGTQGVISYGDDNVPKVELMYSDHLKIQKAFVHYLNWPFLSRKELLLLKSCMDYRCQLFFLPGLFSIPVF